MGYKDALAIRIGISEKNVSKRSANRLNISKISTIFRYIPCIRLILFIRFIPYIRYSPCIRFTCQTGVKFGGSILSILSMLGIEISANKNTKDDYN